MANGNVAPVRSIEGQTTRLGRTMHGIEMDTMHDEVVVTNPFAEAVLFFRGGASGEEPPVRIIQGPHTYLSRPDTLELDPKNNEVYVPMGRKRAVLVFPRNAQGDVTPVRILRSSKVRFNPRRVAVDPINNLLVVGNTGREAGLLLFNRTDQGDVVPLGVIAGPKTGIGIMVPQALEVNPARKEIIMALASSEPSFMHQNAGFIGVWNYSDRGDVAPKTVLGGPTTMIIRPRGLALNYEKKEVMVADMARNALYTFFFPKIF